VAANQVTWTGLQSNDGDTHLNKDFGADHFTEALMQATPHTLSCRETANGGYHNVVIWAVTNTVDDMRTWELSSSQAASVRFYSHVSGTPSLVLTNHETNATDYSIALSVGTTYYLSITRAAGALTCSIYSDADRNNLIDSISRPANAARNYRYAQTATNWNQGSAYVCSGWVADLDVGEAASGGPPPRLMKTTQLGNALGGLVHAA